MKTKETHTINQIEELMYDLQQRLVKSITKEEKAAILKQLKPLQRHWNDVQEKHINGKKYPKRMPSLRSDHFGYTDEEKDKLLKLIDSVKSPKNGIIYSPFDELDLSGGSPVKGEKRFRFREKGW